MSLLNIPSSRNFIPSPESADLFTDLDGKTATRAAYFRETALACFEDLHNIYEPEYLTIEPSHPYRASGFEGIGKFVCGSQPEIRDGSDEVERTNTRSQKKNRSRS